MPVLDFFLWLFALPFSTGLWAYVGLGPGQEFIPQFLVLLSFAATALLAIIQWPIAALLSRLAAARRKRQEASAANRQS